MKITQGAKQKKGCLLTRNCGLCEAGGASEALLVFSVCACVFFLYIFFQFNSSGGRNIVVTGSGFDLIQTAVMKVQVGNLTAIEVTLTEILAF